MRPLFNSVQIKKPKTNVFDLSHEKKLSMNMGDLVPIMIEEVVPGDKFRCNTELMMRFAPMIAPVMHRVNVYTHFFFVPSRLVWNEWETFITGGSAGTSAPVYPKITYPGSLSWADFKAGTLSDYMGIPVAKYEDTITQPLSVSVLPFRAYQMIYNEYYRDQNLEAPIEFAVSGTVSSADIGRLVTLRKRAWEKDYFTSCLPWAQRGGEVLLPIEGSVTFEPDYAASSSVFETVTGNPAEWLGLSADGLGNLSTDSNVGEILRLENLAEETEYEIDSTSVTINDLRRSIKLQEWLEKNARAGSRYIEQIFSHFGVKSSDARLQRPEYLGGGKSPVVISEVLSTAETTETPQGNMAGHGIAVGNSNRFSKYFEEHGYIIGIMSCLPRTAYQQGIDRMYTKFDKLDYYWPEFAHLGEQEVLLKELYHDWNAAAGTSDKLFGYQSRYAEYKFRQSTVHGDFKGNLDYWHMGRIFGSEPALNNTFIKVDSDTTDRIFSVLSPEYQKLYVQLYNDVKAIRPMPVFGTPTI